MILLHILFCVLFLNKINNAKELRRPVTANNLITLLNQEKHGIIIVDFREEKFRELNGFIEGSVLIPDVMDSEAEVKLRQVIQGDFWSNKLS